jgi:hypothetical protein
MFAGGMRAYRIACLSVGCACLTQLVCFAIAAVMTAALDSFVLHGRGVTVWTR